MDNWKARYARMKKHYGWTNADVAAITGHTPDAIKQMVNVKPDLRDFPRWLRLAIVIFEKEHPINEPVD